MSNQRDPASRPRRRAANPLPKNRYQRGVELKRNQPTLGSMLIAIDIAWRRLSARIDRAVDDCEPRASGSIVGSTVQVSHAGPRHEAAFEWLDSVRDKLEELVREAPA